VSLPSLHMRRSTAILTIACLMLLAMGHPEHLTGEPPAELRVFVRANTAFAFDLERRLASPGANHFCSPYSVAVAVALAQSGARGQTEQQITNALQFPAPAETQAALARIRKSLGDAGQRKRIALETATGLWAQKNYEFSDDFLRRARHAFAAEVRLVEFGSRSAAVAGEVNAWVGRQTRGKIERALTSGRISPATRLVLVNTIYFKGQWANRFDQQATKTKPFRIAREDSVSVPMMQQRHEARYAETDSLQMVELPYAGLGLSMLVLLPREPDGLPELEQQLSWNRLTNWMAVANWRTVDLQLPRFKVTSQLALVQPLSRMGMTDAFNPVKADFTGMTPRRPLWIDFLEQFATVEVNEEGTVAAAATSVGFACSMVSTPPPATFHANHPFLFLVRDNRTGLILFLGRVINPAQS
jgi:serpin B